MQSPHSPQHIATNIPGGPDRTRIHHATAQQTFTQPPAVVFNALTQWARYEDWAPGVQGPAHWLAVRRGGPGSQFILYDKPGGRHLAHFGTVTAVERDRLFEWRAPFGEWQRADIGSTVEFQPTSTGGTEVRETLFFEADRADLSILDGFLATPGFDADTFNRFLGVRLAGLRDLLDEGALSAAETAFFFDESRVISADWPGRVSAEGEWVRLLYADGELDFDGPPDVVFNAFTRFARYADWTRMIHVGAEWLDVRAGGVGSKFLLWEKPGDRHVLHYAAVTEFERSRKFTWRAPFSEWGKVFIGTSMTAMPRADGGTHVYHILYADMPHEFLPVFGGFGTLHGFDLQFETFHIYEEARGFNRLLQADGFSDEDRSYFFDADQTPAQTWPLHAGRPWPQETLTLQPDRVITYEGMIVELSDILADQIPSPAFMRQYRDLARTRRFNNSGGDHAHP